MQEEMEHQQQTSLDGFGDNTFVDSPQDAADSDFIISNKNINIIRTGFTKSSHLDINETNSQFCQNNAGNMENNVAAESNALSDQVNAYDKSKSTIGVNLRVTGQCCQGGRKYMEDFFSVAYQQTDNMRDLEYAFIGIYDGHGGSEAATFAKEHLMMEIINQKQFWSDSDQDVLRAIREGYIATHYAMWREQENWPKTTNGLLSTAGTTATIAFIRNEKIYIGHVGDSGVVLGYQNEGENFWRAKQLTTDHKPESPAERSRIMHAGGKVGVKSGVPRVVWTRPRNHGHRGPVRANTPVEEIPFLAVARSLGDLWSYNAEFNEFVVSPDPDVQVIDINPNTFRCLIFGTDGLWNVVTAQEAVDTVCSREKMNESIAQNKQTNEGKNVPWINPSKGLVELALRTWSEKKMRADNTSVVTVILYPLATNSNKSAAESPQIDSKKEQRKSVNDENFATFLDDRTNFQEISEKYLRPERFRNINNPHYENEYLGWNTADAEGMRSNSWLWRCDTDAETEDNETSEANESTQIRMDQSLQSFDELAKPRTVYTNATRIVDIESVHKINSVDHSDLYVNSFAETYNSLLDAQISRSSKEQPVTLSEQPATTSTPLSSSSGLHMQQILQEQQMYQQQCMSGEDGYMLTTLETRREQQRFAGMPTFKVFEAVQSESDSYNADSISFMVNTEENSDSDSLRAELASVLEQNVTVAEEKVEESTIASEVVENVTEEEKEIKQEPVEEEELITIKQEIKEEPEQELVEQKEQEKCDVEKPQKPSPKKFKTHNKASCVETTPSLVEDEDGVLEGARSFSPSIQHRVQRKCYVQITDVSYVDEVEKKEKIATHSDFVEHIDKIEILADKPELVIESGPTSSKPNTRSTTGAATAKTKQDKQYFRDPPPFYKPQRSQPGLRSYNGWMPGNNARLPTENEFSEFIRANMDYAAASAFSSFVDAMKRRFPGFNVDNTLFSKIFDPRHMRYHDFTINAKNNRNNRHTANAAGKGAMPNMTSKGPIPAMFGKSKEGTQQPTTNGKAKSGKRSMPTGAGEMIVNYFLLKQKQFAAQERKAQNKDETTKKKKQKTDGTDDSFDDDDDEDDDDENPEDLQYYESILATWLPLMDSMEDPEFQRHLLKSKDFMDCFDTMPAWSTNTNTETSHATTNGTEKTDAKSKPKATRSTTTTASTAESTKKVEISKGSKVSATKEKDATTTTLTDSTKCEKEVQIPIARTVKVHSKKPAPKSTTITTTPTTTTTAAATKPKSCKNKSAEVSPTAAATATATADVAVEPKTRASKRATSIESAANTRSAVGSTSSTTATATENLIVTIGYILGELGHYLIGVTSKQTAIELDYGDKACQQNNTDFERMDLPTLCDAVKDEDSCSALSLNGTGYCEWNYNGLGIDYQILAGPTFILIFTIAGVFMGFAADKYNRVRLLMICTFVFAIATILQGTVKQYWQLVILRMIMAAGESGCNPLATGILSDIFPENKRALVMAIFNWGIYGGYGIAFPVGRYITKANFFNMGWRVCYFGVGILGLVFATLTGVTLKEPERKAIAEANKNSQQKSEDASIWQVLRNPAMIMLMIAASVRHCGGMTFAYNADLYYNIYFPDVDLGWWLFAVTIGIGSIGVVVGGIVSDKIVAKMGVRSRALVLALSQLIATLPAFGSVYFDPLWAMITLGGSYFFAEMWFGIVFAIVVEIVPLKVRSATIGLFLFVMNNIGGNLPILVDPVAKAIGYRGSIMIFYAGFYGISSILFLITCCMLEGRQEPEEHTTVPDKPRNVFGHDNSMFVVDETLPHYKGMIPQHHLSPIRHNSYSPSAPGPMGETSRL